MIDQLKSVVKRLIGYTPTKRIAFFKGIKISATDSTISFTKKDEVIIISKRHEIYSYDMVAFFDYYFTSVQYKQSGKFKIVDYSKTSLHVLTKSKVGFYFSSLPESDHSTELYLEKFQLKKGDVIFDLGAYCGATSYFFSKEVGTSGKVISIEADPINYETFKKNIELHKLENVIPLHNYIWYKKDSIVFNSEGNMGSTAVNLLGRDDNTVTIPSLTLDDLLQYTDGKVDAIKMDIEGAESGLIAKSELFLRTHRPKLVIEPHFVNGVLNSQALIDDLVRYGYKYEILKQDELHLPIIFAY